MLVPVLQVFLWVSAYNGESEVYMIRVVLCKLNLSLHCKNS
jgi:hypothetical protein